MSELVDLQPKIVEKMIDDNIIMIDVRREEECLRTGLVKKSFLLTFFDERGEYNLENWMSEFQKLVPNKDQTFILICARGNRTRTIGDYLISQGYKNTSHLFGGIVLWQQELRETIKYGFK